MDFFTNYDSPKSNEFMEHNQICATFFWNQINVQIRIKALRINKTDENFSDLHYTKRSKEKIYWHILKSIRNYLIL